LILVALAIRLALVFATPHLPLVNDPADYDRLGQSIANGDGFGQSQFAAGGGPTALRPPLYPLFLGGIYKVFGHHVRLARAIQAVVGAGTVWLIGLFALQLFGSRAAVAAMLIAAIYPPLWMANSALLAESIFLPLEIGALVAAFAYRRRARARPDGNARALWWCALSGLLIGLAILARPVGELLLIPLALFVWLGPRPFRPRALLAPILIGVLAVATIAPWTVRNYDQFHRLVPVSTFQGFVLAGTYNDTARNDKIFPGAYRPANLVPELLPIVQDRTLDEAQEAKKLRSYAVDYAKAHKGYVVEVVWRNTLRLFDLAGRTYAQIAASFLGYGKHLTDLALVAWFVVALLAIGGAFTRPGRSVPLAFWLGPLLLWGATVTGSGTARYRAPLEPFFIVLAGVAVVFLYEKLRPQVAA
jgi:4-amino-4-deoxy-L-arabinose transferase-like glycosyltransferase